jgi:hypothetical protein
MSKIEELLARKSGGSGLKSREYGCMDSSLTSPTIGGRSVGMVRSRTQATELSFFSGILIISEPYRPPRPIMGIALVYLLNRSCVADCVEILCGSGLLSNLTDISAVYSESPHLDFRPGTGYSEWNVSRPFLRPYKQVSFQSCPVLWLANTNCPATETEDVNNLFRQVALLCL